MANRPVFCAIYEYPYVKQINIDFDYFNGFSIAQKQRTIKSLHDAFTLIYPNKRVFEVSTKSFQNYGKEFSAFNLRKYVPSLDRKISVENIFQSSKVFESGGPYSDLLLVGPKEAKKDLRVRNHSSLLKFSFEGDDYPLVPRTIFYDWIYMNALLENEEKIKILLEYDAFTDIEFIPSKSINCQAKTCAAFVSLYKLNKIDVVTNFKDYYDFIINQ